MTFVKERQLKVGRVAFARRWTTTHKGGRNGGWRSEGQWSKIEGCVRKWGLRVCERVSESDGSPHLPLSSSRTNYKVMDSRLITRATGGFKLAGSSCHAWCDGERQEGREGWGDKTCITGDQWRKKVINWAKKRFTFTFPSHSSPSFLPLLLSSGPFIQKLCCYFPSAVSRFWFVSAISVSFYVLPCPCLSCLISCLFSLSQISPSFIPPRLWRSVS